MKLRFFDFEVLPHWWLCVLGDLPDDVKDCKDLNEGVKDTFTVINSDMLDARDLLMTAMKECDICLVGYNIKHYDLQIANAVYQAFTPEQVKMLNDCIISPDMTKFTKEQWRIYPFRNKKLQGVVYQDLMDDITGSLKAKEAILGLDIRESDVDFNKEDLTAEDKKSLTYYCKHDVYSTMYYYMAVAKGYVDNKLKIGKTFNIPSSVCYVSTNANLVAKSLGAVRRSFADSEETHVKLPSKIIEYVYENVPKNVIEQVLNNKDTVVYRLFGNDVSFGNGGIHSTPCDNVYFEEDDEYMLVNVDATSYYPSMLIQFNFLSRCVEDPNRYKRIFDDRVALKHKPNRTEAENDAQLAYKLVLNTTFGASGNKYLDLFDPYMCISCCRTGQLFLAALANKIYNYIPGTTIVQTNTDGILAYTKRCNKEKLLALMDEWSEISGIGMEDEYISKIWQKDVNNYLLVFTNGEEKRKGIWLIDNWNKPGYFDLSPLSAYVSQKAAKEFLLTGKSIVKTIVEDHNLFDFAISAEKGKYKGMVQALPDGSYVKLYNSNRVYATKDESQGVLMKYKTYKGKLSYARVPKVPEHCMLINNEISTYDFKRDIQPNIDYMYYIEKAAELLDIDWLVMQNGKLVPSDRFRLDLD